MRKIKKEYWILLMFAIGRDTLDFWTRMSYDKVYMEIEGLWSHFKVYHKKHILEDFETVVTGYLRNELPDTTQI